MVISKVRKNREKPEISSKPELPVPKLPDQFCTVESIDNINLYWLRKKPDHISSNLFYLHLPFYADFNKDITNLVGFINEVELEGNAITLFYPPGVGKTTICRFAAAAAHAIYIRLPANKKIMNTIKSVMNSLTSPIPARNLILLLHVISLNGFVRILELIHDQIQSTGEYSILGLHTNGFYYQIPEDITIRQLENLKVEAIQDLEKNQKKLKSLSNLKFVIHFDELQSWGTPIKEFKRLKGEEIVQPGDIPYYHLSCFAEIIQEHNSTDWMKFFFFRHLVRITIIS
jgi:hypothetical protein